MAQRRANGFYGIKNSKSMDMSVILEAFLHKTFPSYRQRCLLLDGYSPGKLLLCFDFYLIVAVTLTTSLHGLTIRYRLDIFKWQVWLVLILRRD